MNNNTNASMGDQEKVNDFILSEKQLESAYNTYASECCDVKLRDTLLNILTDVHKIQSELFTAAQSRGWYQVEQADQNKITQAYQKFSKMQMQ